MTDFDLKSAAKEVERLANVAGGDWKTNPSNYNSDAAHLSQAMTDLARHGLLEQTLAQVTSDEAFFGTTNCNPRVEQIDRDTGGKVTGVEFNVSTGWGWGNMVYANIAADTPAPEKK